MINFPVVRLYATAEAAKAGVANLIRWGFGEDEINVVSADRSNFLKLPRMH